VDDEKSIRPRIVPADVLASYAASSSRKRRGVQMVYESLLNTGYEQVFSAYVQVRSEGVGRQDIEPCPPD
jgi:hypothetical protein